MLSHLECELRQRERPKTSSPTWGVWKSGNSEVQNLLIAKLIKIIKLCDRNESERWIGGEHGTGQASISFLSNVFQFRFREWKQESVTVRRIRNETKITWFGCCQLRVMFALNSICEIFATNETNSKEICSRVYSVVIVVDLIRKRSARWGRIVDCVFVSAQLTCCSRPQYSKTFEARYQFSLQLYKTQVERDATSEHSRQAFIRISCVWAFLIFITHINCKSRMHFHRHKCFSYIHRTASHSVKHIKRVK